MRVITLSFLFLSLVSCSSGISEQDYITLQEEYTALQESHADLQDRYSVLEEDYAALQQDYDSIQQQVPDLQNQLTVASERIKALTAAAESTNAQPEQERKARTEAEQKLEEANNQVKTTSSNNSTESTKSSTGTSASNSSTSKSSVSTSSSTSTDSSASTGQMVWIPQNGKKYHSTSSCSGMKNPSKVSISTAKSQGYTACKNVIDQKPSLHILYAKKSSWQGANLTRQKEGGCKEMTETELKNTQKAMAYDLIRIFEQDPDKTYTAEELKKIIDAYITGSQQ